MLAAGIAILAPGPVLANDTVTSDPNDLYMQEVMQTLTAAGYHGLRVIKERRNHLSGYDADGNEVVMTIHPTSGQIEKLLYVRATDD